MPFRIDPHDMCLVIFSFSASELPNFFCINFECANLNQPPLICRSCRLSRFQLVRAKDLQEHQMRLDFNGESLITVLPEILSWTNNKLLRIGDCLVLWGLLLRNELGAKRNLRVNCWEVLVLLCGFG